MRILLKNSTVLDHKSPFHTKTVDILIVDGRIKEISQNINTSAELLVSEKNLHASKGWFDSSVCFGEPGFEDRETIKNGLKTASHSGFTDICLQPDTSPKIDNRSVLSFLKNKSSKYPCKIHPIACFSVNGKGNKMTEFFELWKSISPSQLSCPLDVHSGRVARKLRILTRNQNDFKATLELDLNLKNLNPNDPVKYDFALFGLGVFEKF